MILEKWYPREFSTNLILLITIRSSKRMRWNYFCCCLTVKYFRSTDQTCFFAHAINFSHGDFCSVIRSILELCFSLFFFVSVFSGSINKSVNMFFAFHFDLSFYPVDFWDKDLLQCSLWFLTRRISLRSTSAILGVKQSISVGNERWIWKKL